MCPPGSYKLHRLSAPIYTALFISPPTPGSAAVPGVGGMDVGMLFFGDFLWGDAGMVDGFTGGDGSDFLGCGFGELWEI